MRILPPLYTLMFFSACQCTSAFASYTPAKCIALLKAFSIICILQTTDCIYKHCSRNYLFQRSFAFTVCQDLVPPSSNYLLCEVLAPQYSSLLLRRVTKRCAKIAFLKHTLLVLYVPSVMCILPRVSRVSSCNTPVFAVM